jgi:hypothetical protein
MDPQDSNLNNRRSTDTDGTNLVQGLIEVLPILTVIIGVAAGWFNLQGQVIDLRARYEASTASSREAIVDMRNDIKETNTLIRQLLQQEREREPSKK